MSGIEIIGLVLNASDVSFRVISAAVEYGQKVKGAARQTEAIQDEVQDVSKMLDSLHLRAKEAKESNDALQQWPSLKDIDGRGSPLMQIRLELNVLLDLLNTKKMSKIEQLLWPRKLKKVERSLHLIAKQKEVLMQKMTVDTGSAILMRKWNTISLLQGLADFKQYNWISECQSLLSKTRVGPISDAA